MLTSRIITAIPILIIGVGFTVIGGWAFIIFVTGILAVISWEYWRLFSRGGYTPSIPLLIGGVIIMTIIRSQWGFELGAAAITLIVMAAIAFHTYTSARGCKTSAFDFAITVSGVIYLGWLGAYLVNLRSLPDGLWWLLLVIPAIAIGDSGAYFVGRTFGRHLLAPKVSPHKTVEGYFGGLLSTIIGGMILAALWQTHAPQITLLRGAIMGAVLGLLTPLGDLGESMLKRQFQVKDSSRILGSHGGMFDRLDSWLWGAVIGYYLIVWFW